MNDNYYDGIKVYERPLTALFASAEDAKQVDEQVDEVEIERQRT